MAAAPFFVSISRVANSVVSAAAAKSADSIRGASKNAFYAAAHDSERTEYSVQLKRPGVRNTSRRHGEYGKFLQL